MSTLLPNPWIADEADNVAARKAGRRVLLARREKDALPFGSPAASIKSTRNLLYLAAKGVIPAPVQTARVAQEVTNANLDKEFRRADSAFARASKQAIQQAANAQWASRS